MFKKVEIWVLYLTLLIAFLLIILSSALVRQELVGEKKFGNLSKTALFLAEIPANIHRILTLNDDLIVAENRFPNKTGFVGTPNEEQGYLLLSRYEGTLRENIVELVDLKNFEILQTWNPDISKFNALVDPKNIEFAGLTTNQNDTRGGVLHPILFEDGSLIFKGRSPLKRVGLCGEIVWQNDLDYFHHSSELDHEGNIWVPTEMYPYTLDKFYTGTQIDQYRDDALTKISPDGEVLYQKSLSQIFIDNDMKYLLFSMTLPHFYGDPVHLNDIQPVLSDGPYWKTGDVFVSMRHQSMVLLYRPSTDEIIWKGVGPFYNQHDVDILNDHQIAIFNNNSVNTVNGNVVDGHNEVLIYDFKTDAYTSYLKNSMKEQDVRTITGGRSEIVDNWDLFVEETEFGRLLYFNKDVSLRWEFINRDQKGNLYRVSWVRLLYKQNDLEIVQQFLENKKECL